MNWFRKLSQLTPLGPNAVIPKTSGVSIIGSGQNIAAHILGQSISVREVLNQALQELTPELEANGIKTIDTSPITEKANAIGLAKSDEAIVGGPKGSTIHIDIAKIVNSYGLPPTTELDGTEVDIDGVNGIVEAFKQELRRSLGTVSAHEGEHIRQFSTIGTSTEQSAEAAEKQFGQRHYPNQDFISSLRKLKSEPPKEFNF